jgi:hypothetical protein
MRKLVDLHAGPCCRGAERHLGRHLNVIRRRRIEGTVAANSNHGMAVAQDRLGAIRRTPGRVHGARWDVGRNAFDLAGMEYNKSAQQRDPPAAALAVIVGRIVRLHLEALVEEPCSPTGSFLDLPSAFLSLFVGRPARITGHERERRHAERDDIDAAISRASRGVLRHSRATRPGAIPGLAPGGRAGFEGSDHLRGHFGVMIARGCGGQCAARTG